MMLIFAYIVFFFFFQAEDGIRDIGVTGVQTCALPICPRARARRAAYPMAEGPPESESRLEERRLRAILESATDYAIITTDLERSEERRVGKECRSRWSPYH